MLKSLLIVPALVLALLSPAQAQEKSAAPADGKFPAAVVAVVDIQKILQDSLAAKSVREQLATRRDGYQKEVTADEQKLRSTEKTLSEERAKLSEDDFKKKRQAFEEQVKAIQKKVQERAHTLDKSFNDSLNVIRQTLGQIVAEAAQKRGVTVVLDKGQVVVVESTLDLTALVLDELNKKLPKVVVK